MNKLSIGVRDIPLIGLFTALIAIGAFIKIPIPMVPFTLQLLFTTLAGMLLGKNLGAISVGAYVVLGLIGIPVFTQGGGPGYVFVPTFGYLVGFVLGAYVTGAISNKVANPSYKRLFLASFAGLSIIYALGMAYFYLISNLYLGNKIGLVPLFIYCFALCIPGDIVLCVLASIISKRTIPWLRTTGFRSRRI